VVCWRGIRWQLLTAACVAFVEFARFVVVVVVVVLRVICGGILAHSATITLRTATSTQPPIAHPLHHSCDANTRPGTRLVSGTTRLAPPATEGTRSRLLVGAPTEAEITGSRKTAGDLTGARVGTFEYKEVATIRISSEFLHMFIVCKYA
jgi:hypothetical protein